MRHPDERPAGGAWAGADHPDEGTIHAWLDDALPPAEAAALERHVAGCAPCAAAVAEARGLIAASSQILARLDRVPGGVLPAAGGAGAGDVAAGAATAGTAVPADAATSDPDVIPLAPRRRAPAPGWRRGRLGALAAVALAAVGVTAVLRETGSERSLSEVTAASETGPPERAADAAATVGIADSAAPLAGRAAPAPEEAAAVQQAAPPREAMPREAMPRRTSSAGGAAAPEAGAPARTAEPRAMAAASEEARVAAAPPAADARAAKAAAPPPPAPAPAPPVPAPAGSTVTTRELGAESAFSGRVVRTPPPTSDSAAVVGRVVARGSGAPVAGAVVALQGRVERAVTDSAGVFRVDGVPAGSFVATVQHVGFQPESLTVSASPAAAGERPARQVTVALRPQAGTLSDVVTTGAPVESARPRAGAARAEPRTAQGRAAAPAQPPSRAVERFAGCYRLSVGGAASDARAGIEGTLPGWLRLDRAARPAAGWFVAGSAAGDDSVSGSAARWRASESTVYVEWPADDRLLELRLQPWAEGLAGTAAWREAGEPGEEVSVLARRVVCGG